MKKTNKLLLWLAGLSLGIAGVGVGTYALLKPASRADATSYTWSRVTSISAGDVVTLAAEGATKDSANTACTGAYLSSFSSSDASASNYGKGTGGTFSSGSFSASDAAELTVVAGSATNSYAFKYTTGGTDYYLSAVAGNYLILTASVAAASSWTLTADGTNVKLFNVDQTTRYIRWNNSSPRFAAYTTAQTNIQLYKKGAAVSVTGITGVAEKPAAVLQNATLLASDISLTATYSNSTTGTVVATSVTCDTSTVGNSISATAYYNTYSASFTIKVYAAHTGLTAASPFTCEEAILHTKAADLTASTIYYFSGLFHSTKSNYNSSYGNGSHFLCDAVSDPESRRFEAYKMYSVVKPDDFVQGTTSILAKAIGKSFILYGDVYEATPCYYVDPDNSPVDSFVTTYMHTDVAYTESGSGACTTSGWYASAKTAFNALTTRQRSLFAATAAQYSLYDGADASGNIKATNYSQPLARLTAWATANGETLSATNTLGSQMVLPTDSETDTAFMVGLIAILAIFVAGGYFFLHKRKQA